MTAACPACTVPLPEPDAGAAVDGHVVHLSLPAIRCAGCIAGVERALNDLAIVRDARVNLSRKQVRVVTSRAGAAPLVAALGDAGYEAHELDAGALAATQADAEGRALLTRAAVAGFAMMNVMILSVAVWSGAADHTRALLEWVSAAITLPALAYSAAPFLRSAIGALRAGRMNMDVPIALAITLAAGVSLWEIAAGGGHAWFEAAISLTFFLLIGRWLDHRARLAARSAAAELAALEIPRATVLEGEDRREMAVADLMPGMRIALAPGARVPVDGTSESAAEMDRSALTGEAETTLVPAGARICAGEIVVGRPLVLRATARAEDSTLRRLMSLVETAEGARHRYAARADRVAALYAPVVHILAAAAFAGWWWASGSIPFAIGVATAVLIITCPCALALAAPAVGAAVSGRLFRRGVLLTSPTALERLAQIDIVLIDKTGTLTTGCVPRPDLPDDAAAIGAALSAASDHPVARAVAAALDGVAPARLTDIREVPGQGVFAEWNGQPVSLARGPDGPRLTWPDGHADLAATETLRGGAETLARDLADLGLPTEMVTGDTVERADRVARSAGITTVHAGLTPEQKLGLVQEHQRAGRKVLMLGDGLNDAGALTAADASVSPASALDAARSASDVVLLARDLGTLPRLLAEARGADVRVRQNFGLAIAYNLVAVPVALAGLATPLIAAIAMSTSSLTVVLNALRKVRT